jgi:hypothetical protein
MSATIIRITLYLLSFFLLAVLPFFAVRRTRRAPQPEHPAFRVSISMRTE